nr:glycosyltransferase [Holdemania massiliensis]
MILINSCKGLYGGVESFLLNIFNNLDLERYDVTFLTCGKTTYNMYKKEIIEKGGCVEEIPIYANSIKKQARLYYELYKYYKRKNPDIVHINSGGLSFHFLAARAAKKAGIKSIILHSHNFIPQENRIRNKIKSIVKFKLVHYGTRFLACSKGAAKWIFPDSLVEKNMVEIIPNGIDTKKFAFDTTKRKNFRLELGLTDELIIGNIGRFQPQKNHKFMIKVMKEVVKLQPKARLLLVGEGELKNEIRKDIHIANLDDNVIFLGERKDMASFLSAIDIFILPSLHEGFPISAIEAQTSGAKVILADTITSETNITGEAIFLSISECDAERRWSDIICDNTANLDRTIQKDVVKDAGYDVSAYCERIKQIYNGE